MKAQTTQSQENQAKRTGQSLFVFACKTSGGKMSCDGPIPYDIAGPLSQLMALITADKVKADALAEFVKSLTKKEG